MLIGHGLNIAINILGSFVHTCRLQYLEFFSRFYEDGGTPFDPAIPSEKYSTAELEKNKPKPKPKYNIKALKERLRRLNVTYMAGNKSDEEYLKEDAEIKAHIVKAESEAPPPERDLEPLREVLNADFESVYLTLDPEDKRRFWRSIIKEIQVEDLNVKDVIFF